MTDRLASLKIPAGVIVHGSVFAGASKVQDWEYLRRVERLSAARAAKATLAPDEPQATPPSPTDSRRAKR